MVSLGSSICKPCAAGMPTINSRGCPQLQSTRVDICTVCISTCHVDVPFSIHQSTLFYCSKYTGCCHQSPSFYLSSLNKNKQQNPQHTGTSFYDKVVGILQAVLFHAGIFACTYWTASPQCREAMKCAVPSTRPHWPVLEHNQIRLHNTEPKYIFKVRVFAFYGGKYCTLLSIC